MSIALQYVVLGLGAGGCYALLAQGLVLVYQGSGVLNFAQGAIGMLGGFVFWWLQGENTGGGWGTAPALIATISLMGTFGVLLHYLVLRPLRRQSTIVVVVATLGMYVVIESAATIIWGSQDANIVQFLPTSTITLGSIFIGVNQVVLLGVAVLVTLVLWALARFSRLGVAMRANAENMRAAQALGWSPDALASIAWGAGGVLTAAAAILVGTLSGIQAEQSSLLIFPMLAAAVVGGFSSFPLTLVAGLLIGIGESLIAGYVSVPGAGQGLPLALIVVLVVVRGRGVIIRGVTGNRMPRLGSGRVRPWALIAVLVVLVALIESTFAGSLDQAITVSVAWATIMLSVVVLLGFTGQLSFEQVAMAGLAALVAARLTEAGWPFLAAIVVAIFAAVPIGVLFALPALRTKGVNLAIVTLGLAVCVSALVFGNASITGGSVGTPVNGVQRLFGIDVNPVSHTDRYTLFAIGLFTACSLLIANLRRGAAGRRLIAVRTNELATASLGISVFRAKLFAFIVGASVAAVGGVVLGFSNPYIEYGSFDPIYSTLAVAYAVVGGVGYVLGPIFGAPLPPAGVGDYALTAVWANGGNYIALIGGVGLILILLKDPDGLANTNIRLARLVTDGVRRAGRLVWEAAPGVSPVRRRTAAQFAGEIAERNRGVGATVHRVIPAPLVSRGVTVRYGGVTAVENVDLRVDPGQIVGLIGPNGAGKTSLLNAISGFSRSAAGTVTVGDQQVTRMRVHERARAGLGRSFQSLELFESSTVLENVGIACDVGGLIATAKGALRPRGIELSTAAVSAIHAFELDGYLDRVVSELPYGRRRLVGIARAAAMGPSVLLLDEPAAGLSPGETTELAGVVRALAKEWGMGVLVVEHDVDFIMGLCDHVVALDFGHVIAEGAPEEVRIAPRVIAAYLGDLDAGSTPTPERLTETRVESS
jgi:ABC-type branched-subunit amino acid transport system ATPase component/branched-subunit amino acid ABC-type transport system permease component